MQHGNAHGHGHGHRQHRIVVIGAGYAGAIAAGRLARRLRREDVAITLVNAEPDFVERVRMHQLAVGQELRPRPFSEMFAGTGVRLRLARVTAVDADGRTVSITESEPDGPNGLGAPNGPGSSGGSSASDGLGSSGASSNSGVEELPYDTLVYALGSTWNTHDVPGAADHAHDIAGRPGALRLRERLAALGAGQPVVVVGGGLTGLEAATEIAEARPDLEVTLAARGALGDWLSPKGTRHLRKVMAALGITVHENTTVTGVGADRITTTAGEMPAAVTIWTTGFAAHPIAQATTLKTDATGRIEVDGTMRSLSHPDVYAIGDAALAQGPGDKPLRMSCASGVPMAWQAADSIAARLTGTKSPTAPLRYFNQCISLGRKEGLIQYVTADDRARTAALTGRLAAFYKELVCKGAAWGVANPTLAVPTRRRPTVVRPTPTPPPTPAEATTA
ncbi:MULTISPECIES: NAD(P)/FAD-dependent oxidoreductase [Streptomyces]|uniref:NAD(P)/FAD-dependent oxidoreductase n=1 Tax=Streptomyces TaxID=1883 RepID=UPI00103DAED7|nr:MULTISPECIES: FAD-dependent oxidoreductase [Streptomyces]MBT3076862.1 FAD-dependent oxidoreductase [Streptomyces sp. COG21]MBT3082179.1 FAD-dependent oxidoreductase [Streptomyces sp. COG20]MBT3091059.1 FAD-dependent oxidoreductase [Streptomyces sp. CYG21]MBT3098925.1 FAD-dependent oxidoreductase [Streptomyces sp. CBG30]MBT3104148.1 FAD-dependent oxidoreductase [Streptomyces sp. COG19]